MSPDDTTLRAPGAEDGKVLCCRWERIPNGHLIARWRTRDPGIPLSEAEAVRSQRRADRHCSSSRRRRASERLTAAAAIVVLYFFMGSALVSAFIARNSPVQ